MYYIISMMTTQLLLSNSLTVPHIEMKLGMHACNIISMTTALFEQQQIASANFLLKNYLFTSRNR